MTVLSELVTLADHDPTSAVLFEPDGDRLVPIDRATLIDATLRLRRDLHARGFGEGDCAAVWLPNWSDAIVWQLAVGSLGGHIIGINTRYNVLEVTHVLTLAQPKVVALAIDFVGLDLIGRLREASAAARDKSSDWRAPQVVPLTGPGQPAVADPSAYDVGSGVWLPTATEPLGLDEMPEPAEDHIYVAFTTSGSTGLPKLAAHKQAGTLDQLHAAGRGIGAAPGDRIVGALPLSGTFGFVQAFAVPLAGGAVLLQPSFDPDGVVRLTREEGATHLAFGDDMLNRVRDAAGDGGLGSVRWVGIADFQGSGVRVAQWLESVGVQATGLYGSSETFALLTLSDADVPTPDRWLGGGRLVSDLLDYRIANEQRVITDGSEGEIQFRGPHVVDAYLGQPHKMAENFTADGWFRSGDLGRAIDERTFRYVCRASEALRLKGFLVEPDEIANHLATHEAVEIAKVVGVRRDAGDEAVGFVTLKEGAQADGDELVEYCRAALAKYKVPVAVFVIDAMPVTTGTNGTKIRSAVLSEWAAERLG